MTLTNYALDCLLLETARRRTVYVHIESERLHETPEAVRRAFKRLLRRKDIWCSDESKSNYFGSTGAGYRAN